VPEIDVLDRVRQLDNATLEPVVRGILGDDSASPMPGWVAKPIGGSFGPGTLGIFHVSGTASIASGVSVASGGSGTSEWSVVAKVMDLDATSQMFAHSSPAREIKAYESGLLNSIGSAIPVKPSLRGAQHFGVNEIAGLGTILWVEDLSAAIQAPWEDAVYLEVGRQLGHFNAVWELNPPKKQEWFLADGFSSRIGGTADRYDSVFEHLDDQYVQLAATPVNQEYLSGLKEILASVIPVLNAGPTPLSHVDSQPRNLFPIHQPTGGFETAAIDWASLGYAPLGTDASHLVGSTMTWGEIDPEHGAYLHTQILNSYIEGLKEAGWAGDENLVRLAYMTGAVARAAANITFPVVLWIDNPGFEQGVNPIPPEVKAKNWGDVLPLVYPLFQKELDSVRL
jgi:hypothetical protein